MLLIVEYEKRDKDMQIKGMLIKQYIVQETLRVRFELNNFHDYNFKKFTKKSGIWMAKEC